jgi:cytochrome P450
MVVSRRTKNKRGRAANKKFMYDAFSPFSIGPRGCAGKAMAYLEMGLVLVKTFWYLNFERPSGKLDAVGEGYAGNKHGREGNWSFK